MRQLALLAALVVLSGGLWALERQVGPVKVPVGDVGEWQVPEGHFWFPPSELPEFFRSTKTPSKGDELGVLGRGGDQFYALVVSFDTVGSVTDPAHYVNESFLDDLRAGVVADNAKAVATQGPQIGQVDWGQSPLYDPKTGRLSFSVRMQQNDRGTSSVVVNHYVNLFGKRGVLRCTVVCTEASYDDVKADVDRVLDGFQFSAEPEPPFSLFKLQLLGGALVLAYFVWKKRADAKKAG